MALKDVLTALSPVASIAQGLKSLKKKKKKKKTGNGINNFGWPVKNEDYKVGK